MKCPFCHFQETRVVDTRESDNLEATRRRRECLKCGKRFTTYERAEMAGIVIVKKDGRREPFNRAKLLAGLQKACEKRPISTEAIEKVVNEVESELRRRDSREVKSSVLGQIVMRRLRSLDKVAYLRFASVYLAFEDLSSFEKELKKLTMKRRRQGRDT